MSVPRNIRPRKESNNMAIPRNSFANYSSTPQSRRMSMVKLASTPLRSPAFQIDTASPNLQASANMVSSVSKMYLDDTVSRHSLSEEEEPLAHPGADITHDLYAATRRLSTMSRSRSMEDIRSSMANSINVPGGFRREHILAKRRQEMESVPFLTRNFFEFLYVYGHFAGETFEDEYALEDEDTPLLGRRIEKAKGTTSTMKAFLLMIKSFIGTGVLFLPRAFMNGGLVFSMCMLLAFGVYSFWCYYILIQSKVATNVSSFGDIGGQLYGKGMKFLILFSLVITQLGFASAYIVFVGENLKAFVWNIFRIPTTTELFLLLQIAIFIPLSFIRNVGKLSLPSLFANVFIMIGLVIVVFFTASHLVSNGAQEVIFFNSNNWSLFIGTAIFAYEGIGLIIPIQDSMAKPEKFPMVLGLVIGTATVLFVIIACLGYLSFGSDIQTVILLNLPQDSLFVNSIQFFYSLAILLSVPLQLFPAIGIIESKLFTRQQQGKHSSLVKWKKNAFRSCLVLFCVGLAWVGADRLDTFVSFIGCFACIPLVYMYPPLLHLKSVAKTTSARFFDYCLIIFGLLSLCYTTWQIVLTL